MSSRQQSILKTFPTNIRYDSGKKTKIAENQWKIAENHDMHHLSKGPFFTPILIMSVNFQENKNSEEDSSC
jgi:hypothetical protein